MYALSMYESRDQLKKKLVLASQTAPKLVKALGDHCVELRITALDGVRTRADASGHFDFHESLSFDAPTATTGHERIWP